MDSTNISALAHAVNITLQALLSTHQNPKDLNDSLSHYLRENTEVLATNEKLVGAITVWVNTFRQHIPATAEPPPP